LGRTRSHLTKKGKQTTDISSSGASVREAICLHRGKCLCRKARSDRRVPVITLPRTANMVDQLGAITPTFSKGTLEMARCILGFGICLFPLIAQADTWFVGVFDKHTREERIFRPEKSKSFAVPLPAGTNW